MIPPITDDLNTGTNHSLESNFLLSLRPIVKYPGLKFWFGLSAQCYTEVYILTLDVSVNTCLDFSLKQYEVSSPSQIVLGSGNFRLILKTNRLLFHAGGGGGRGYRLLGRLT